MSTADVLLLDEPTNHLDLETTRWLEQYLAAGERTVLLVSHDRAFLSATVDHVLHFEGGTATPYSAGYTDFVAQRAERRLAQQRAFEQQQRTIAHEQDYIARNIAGQNSKQAKGRRKRLERLPRLSPVVGPDGVMALRFEVTERGGDQVVTAKNVSVAVAARTLVERFSGTLERTGVVGIIGRNGAGKSTLLRALLGEHPLHGGELRLGASITTGYYRQDLSQVPLDGTLYEVIAVLRPKWERGQIQGHLGRFGFSGQQVLRRADSLSGGERARVALAMLMLSGANLLILDEPTNHLASSSASIDWTSRWIRRHGDPREPRPGVVARADDADLDPARPAHDRVRRRIRGVGGSEHGAGPRRRGQRRRGASPAAGARTPPGGPIPEKRSAERPAPRAARARGGGGRGRGAGIRGRARGGSARGPGALHASRWRRDGPHARCAARDPQARPRRGARAMDAGHGAGRDASAAIGSLKAVAKAERDERRGVGNRTPGVEVHAQRQQGD